MDIRMYKRFFFWRPLVYPDYFGTIHIITDQHPGCAQLDTRTQLGPARLTPVKQLLHTLMQLQGAITMIVHQHIINIAVLDIYSALA